jgi:uncharacterized protein (TIGR02453 family)
MTGMEKTIIGARRTAAPRTPSFPGFPPEALAFFRSLERNNRREWFQPRKQVFDEKVRGPMIELVEALNAALMQFAPAYVQEPASAIYRIYRDTRFSHDKTPYKTHIAAIFPRRGLQKHSSAGFYVAVSPKGIDVGGGIYMPTTGDLRTVRRHLSAHHEEFRALVGARSLRTLMGELQGEQLSRPPKGFPKDHPAADLVRYKQWYLFVTLAPELATTPRLLPELVKRFRALTPFMELLNAPLAGTKKKPPVLWD